MHPTGSAGASEAGKFQLNLRYKTMDKYNPELKCLWHSILQQNGTITVRSNAGTYMWAHVQQRRVLRQSCACTSRWHA